jgi:PBP1b-binding outer membrane lipoprotein LpoB
MKQSLLILLIAMYIVGCKEPIIKEPSLLESISGEWKVETANLDGILKKDWDQMVMTINLEEGSLSANCINQPIDRIQIWPNTTNWFYRSSNEFTNGSFIRNDSITILVFLSEEKLNISLHPPREWSYYEACPNDNSTLICGEEGQWTYVLEK